MAGAWLTNVDQRRPDLRFPFPERFAERLTGRRIDGLRRRAKYLIASLDGADLLVMHLGMSGSFRVEQAGHLNGQQQLGRSKNTAHDHVVFDLSTGVRIVYNDPRRFGFMDLVPRLEFDAHPLFRGLGIEPLGGGLDGAALARLFAGKATSLKAALLDQTL